MSWMNGDGLFVKYGREEAAVARGGEYGTPDMGRHVIEFIVDYRDAQSTSSVIIGANATAYATGTPGVLIPAGFIPEELVLTATTAFTSSGTIGTSTLVLGSVKASDRSTAYDVDGLTTTSFVLGVLDATSEDVIVNVGTTGAGDDFGVAYTEAVYICAANSQHASHPLTAGVARCRLIGRYGLSVV
jgi:hypothetical protein